MSRTIAALYDSRAEAESARALLVQELKVKAPTIVARDTIGAIDGFRFNRKDADAYRDGLRRGAHLLVAQVEEGANGKRIVELLQAPMTGTAELRDVPPASVGAAEGVEFRIADESNLQSPPPVEPAVDERKTPLAEDPSTRESTEKMQSPVAGLDDKRQRPSPPSPSPVPVEEAHIPVVSEELRVGKREFVRGGARVRSFTREAPAEEQVTLQQDVFEIENRPSGRQLSDSDLEAGGLFKDRVFEIAEMREEPVVTKVAVVREEVIVRKTVKERTETIRDTVRHTEIEVEDLASSESPALFGDTQSGPAPAR